MIDKEAYRKALDADVALSSRVRLARDFEDMPFPDRQNDIWAQEAVRRVFAAISERPDGRQYRLMKMAELSEDQRTALVERHIVSPDLLEHAEHAAVMTREDERVSVMINEEDHVRIQAILPGLDIAAASSLADEVDDSIGALSSFAYDDAWGYLTACPTNTGTGMRISAMLHLPAMVMTGQMAGVVKVVGKMGMTVRGLYGEGSGAMGNLFQLSNQVTLGQSERDIAANLEAVARQLIDRERLTREAVGQQNRIELEDRLMRSLGALRHARKMENREFMGLWSDVWLANELGWLDIEREALRQLFIRVQPATIEVTARRSMTPQERDIERARIVRDTLDDEIAVG